MDQINVSELPNILQVLDEIAEDELKHKLDPLQSSHISCLDSENKYLMVRSDDDQSIQLMPSSPSRSKFFRGQSEYFNECHASIHRGLSSTEVMLERLRTCEFTFLLNTNPVVQDFFRAGFHVDAIGLAQHYGLKTEVLDVTNNKWIAAFFACTAYSNGTFELLNNTFESKIGILYTFEYDPYTSLHEVFIIGAQPFDRPTKQNAYGIKFNDPTNFNTIEGLRIIPFRHDGKAENILYEMFYRSKRIFPDDILVNVVDTLKKIREISFPAVASCKDVYYPGISEMEYSNQLSKIGITVVPEARISFPKDQLEKQCEYWWKYGRDRLGRKINMIHVTRISIE